MVNAQPRIPLKKWDAQTPLGFWDTNRSPNFGQTTSPDYIKQKKKKENSQNCVLCCPIWPQGKVERKPKERCTYFFLGNWKKLWSMKTTEIPIVIGTLGTVTKWLVQGLEDLEIPERVETIQAIVLLRSVRILWRVAETWGDLLSLRFQRKTIS